MLKNRKAAGLIEYAIIIGTISLALTTMNVYIKRGIQAEIRDVTSNSIADDALVRNFLGDGLGEDRFRDRVSSDFTTTTSATTTLNVQGGTTTTNLSENIQRSGNERIVEPLSFWNSPKSTVPGSRGQPRKPPYPEREEHQEEIDEKINEWQGGVGGIELPDSNRIDREQIQTALKNAGYYQGPIDGKIGQKTRRAIKRFQRANNLPVTGRVDGQTWLLLKDYLQDPGPGGPEQPVEPIEETPPIIEEWQPPMGDGV